MSANLKPVNLKRIVEALEHLQENTKLNIDSMADLLGTHSKRAQDILYEITRAGFATQLQSNYIINGAGRAFLEGIYENDFERISSILEEHHPFFELQDRQELSLRFHPRPSIVRPPEQIG